MESLIIQRSDDVYIFQNILFCALQKKEMYTGLEQHEGENYPFNCNIYIY